MDNIDEIGDNYLSGYATTMSSAENLQPEKGQGYSEMDNPSEKRSSERRACNAVIEFSYFNQAKKHEAKVLNCCAGGMCFQSSQLLQPGATVCIRVKDFQSFVPQKDNVDCLRCMSLAEVKWCNELPGADSAAYCVGVKYQAPHY